MNGSPLLVVREMILHYLVELKRDKAETDVGCCVEVEKQELRASYMRSGGGEDTMGLMPADHTVIP